MTESTMSIEKLAIDTIRTLSMDGVQAANSGHPGTPMALAPVAYTLGIECSATTRRLPTGRPAIASCSPAATPRCCSTRCFTWPVCEAWTRMAMSLTSQRSRWTICRTSASCTAPVPGIPEFGEAAGIETTTGPLGQGVATSVGMAIAAQWYAARYNRPGFDLFGYDVYALCSDGDLMEGVACEAASLAGHLQLSNLCWIYDDNSITIEGNTDWRSARTSRKRFKGLGWNTVKVKDANDMAGSRRR